MKAGSEEIPVRRTGWLCTTSASREPSITTRFTPSDSAASSSTREKVCQRIDGSAPATSSRSCGPSGGRATSSSTSGHMIADASGELRSISGRVAWKS